MARWRAATQAERALWGAAMRNVRPLNPSTVVPVLPPPPEPIAAAEIVPPSPIAVPAPPRVPGAVDRATVERMKRGQVNVEARIDLHGMDQRAAFSALMGFIDTAARAGRRAVLVITGKGAVSGGGVLRRNAPNWLMSSPLAGRILTIQPAHTRHGGDGAFYVLLRRKKI